LVMARTFLHQSVVELAAGARVPVINGLSDLHHPCQVLSDCFTLLERRGRLAGLRVAFIGDGNNVVHSWMDAAVRLGFGSVLAGPQSVVFEQAENRLHVQKAIMCWLAGVG